MNQLLCVIGLFCSQIITGETIPQRAGYALLYPAPALVILAHNNFDGGLFAGIESGDVIRYGGDLYRVTEIIQAQALTPSSPASSLVWDGTAYTHVEAWRKIYDKPGTLVLQTCIKRGDVWEWGRLFIIAYPFRLDPPRAVIL